MVLSKFKPTNQQNKSLIAEEIRVRGTVQGVGFRPTVYRLAKDCGLRGEVGNDGQGVLIRVIGTPTSINTFVQRLQTESPPLAKITEIIRNPALDINIGEPTDFTIVQSNKDTIRTEITPDAATCLACQSEIFSPFSRWYQYPFTSCTHCGPRLSIIKQLPYDRANTSMAKFEMCSDCAKDYHEPANRRFHAQPTACPICGPHIWLERAVETSRGVRVIGEEENKTDPNSIEIDTTANLLRQGYIIAIKGLGGFHLACDATNEETVQKLRQRKQRPHKPLALMARDLKIIEQYCLLSSAEKELLSNSAAPIVLLRRKKLSNSKQTSLIKNAPRETKLFELADSVAPDQNTLGFMLPYTPLHHLLLRELDIPLVMTSGNLTSDPQCIDNNEAIDKLGGIADYFLFHNREIVNRVDDSVARIINLENSSQSSYPQEQILRRARGYTPAPINLPADFPDTPPILAMGSELKNTFCLLRDGQAIVSQHIGNLANNTAFAAYRQTLNLYLNLLEHQPAAIAVDLHPEYLSTKLGKELAEANSLTLYNIQHHHAHIAACMVENEVPFYTSPVLGIALDGLGYGEDGTFWGGEFLLADYRSFKRLGSFKPVAMIGGEQAIYQPWRSTYAHFKELREHRKMGRWGEIKYRDLELFKFFEQKPGKILDLMVEKGINSPLASSCGRLFDAVAAAIGICQESCSYESQGAIALEALAEQAILSNPEEIKPYPFSIENRKLAGESYLPYIEPRLMWQALLEDLRCNTPQSIIAAKFHLGLAKAITSLVKHIRITNKDIEIKQAVLTGGVFQNQILLNQVRVHLEAMKLQVFTHSQVPTNDGGLSLGQAAIAIARFYQNQLLKSKCV